MLASHYIFRDILENWDNLKKTRNTFEEFTKRYPNDKELQEVYKEFQDSPSNNEKLQGIKSKLKELQNIRKIENSGGTKLQFSDRRQFGDKVYQR